jgi:hypothetical protein
MHGDGIPYQSMFQGNAIHARCETCHTPLPAGHDSYDPHGGALHCTACHAQTVISCYNCHFESQIQSHVKRAKQPLHDFVMLINRDKDGKVGSGSFQSITHQGDAFVAFGPFTPHTIGTGRGCSECHVNFGGTNAAIEEYNVTGELKFAEWDDVGKALTWKHDIVPIPEDYQTSFKMDFITYDGATSDPPGPSTNWSSIGKDTWDGHQMFFATPLSFEQMEKIGMEHVPVAAVSAALTAGEQADGVLLSWDVKNVDRIDDLRVVRAGTEIHVARDVAPRGNWLDVRAMAGVSYEYVIVATVNGSQVESNSVEAMRSVSRMVTALTEAAPNPFNPATEIRFTLASEGRAKLQIHDVAGRLVQSFDLGTLPAGPGSQHWDGTDTRGQRVASGSYLVTLSASGATDQLRVTLVK